MTSKGVLTIVVASMVAVSGCSTTITQSSFFPDAQLKAPDAVLSVPQGYTATNRRFDLDGIGQVRAVWLDNPASETVIIFSAGNGGFVDSNGTSTIAANLARLTGADIILYDYPGRGGTTIPATIDAAIASGPAMLAQFKAAGWMGRGPAYAYGFSFGGSMAAAMARAGGFAGLIIEGSATDYEAIGRDFVPGFAKPFVKLKTSEDLRKFDYFGYTVSAKAPVLLLSGINDKTIRPKQMRKFADELAAKGVAVTFQAVPTGHGGSLDTAEGSKALQAFIR